MTSQDNFQVPQRSVRQRLQELGAELHDLYHNVSSTIFLGYMCLKSRKLTGSRWQTILPALGPATHRSDRANPPSRWWGNG